MCGFNCQAFMIERMSPTNMLKGNPAAIPDLVCGEKFWTIYEYNLQNFLHMLKVVYIL